MKPQPWPSNQDGWNQLAQRLRDQRVQAIIDKLPPLPEEPPLSPEEEELLF